MTGRRNHLAEPLVDRRYVERRRDRWRAKLGCVVHEEIWAPVCGGAQQFRELRRRIDVREPVGVRERPALRRRDLQQPRPVRLHPFPDLHLVEPGGQRREAVRLHALLESRRRRESYVVALVCERARQRHERRDMAFGRSAREQNPHRSIIVYVGGGS